MKRFLYLILLIASFTSSANSQVKLSTVQPSVGAVVGVQNYVAIIVEGAESKSTILHVIEGPGQLTFDNISQRWLWNWQPSIGDTGRSFEIVVEGAQSDQRAMFVVTPRALIADRFLTNLKKGLFYSGIDAPIRVKQPGLDGEYKLTLTLDDSVVAQVTEPTLAYRPDIHTSVGKQARLTIDYIAPLTGKTVTLTEYTGKVKYPPFRVMPAVDMEVGQPAFFRAALGLQPNFYVPSVSRIFTVESNGYFEDTAQMISSWIDRGEDPFSVFASEPLRSSGPSKELTFDFGLRQTDKTKEITANGGKIILVTLRDPITKQTSSMVVRIYPRRAVEEE